MKKDHVVVFLLIILIPIDIGRKQDKFAAKRVCAVTLVPFLYLFHPPLLKQLRGMGC